MIEKAVENCNATCGGIWLFGSFVIAVLWIGGSVAIKNFVK